MANPVAPIEVVTTEQLGRASDRFMAQCRKNAVSLPKGLAQQVLEDEGNALARDMFEAFRKRIENRSLMIVRHVTVNRKQTPQQVVDASGRLQFIDQAILATMPRSGEVEVDVYFFRLGRDVGAEELDREYEDRGLVPDPYAQAQVNLDDQAFATDHPNGTQWNRNGKVSSQLLFDQESDADDKRSIYCERRDFGRDGWLEGIWLAGVRK